jgi:hypothetical protein
MLYRLFLLAINFDNLSIRRLCQNRPYFLPETHDHPPWPFIHEPDEEYARQEKINIKDSKRNRSLASSFDNHAEIESIREIQYLPACEKETNPGETQTIIDQASWQSDDHGALAHFRFTTLRAGLSAGLPFADARNDGQYSTAAHLQIIPAIPCSIIKVLADSEPVQRSSSYPLDFSIPEKSFQASL